MQIWSKLFVFTSTNVFCLPGCVAMVEQKAEPPVLWLKSLSKKNAQLCRRRMTKKQVRWVFLSEPNMTSSPGEVNQWELPVWLLPAVHLHTRHTDNKKQQVPQHPPPITKEFQASRPNKEFGRNGEMKWSKAIHLLPTCFVYVPGVTIPQSQGLTHTICS